MRLTSLEIENFRQFYGKTAPLRFASAGQDKNVVVIHGANGSGKTALLNAFTWALYGQFTRGFQHRDQLINKRALRAAGPDDTVQAWVEIGFEHEEHTYSLRRTVSAKGMSDANDSTPAGEPQAVLRWCGPDGNWREEEGSAGIGDAIGRILPVDLHHYFFFDGERIERLVAAEKVEQRLLGDATKKLLGIEVFERAESHLNSARKKLEKDLQGIGDPETRKLLLEKEETEGVLKKARERIDELKRNIEESTKHRAVVDDKLRKLDQVRGIQERRDQLEEEKAASQTRFADDSKQLAIIVSLKGFSVFLPSAIAAFRECIQSLREKGELPAGIKRQFVDDLLEACICICGRDLAVGSDAREAVEEWKAKAGPGDVEEKAIRMTGEVRRIEEHLSDVGGDLERLQRKRGESRRAISRIEQELEGIQERLKNSDREEVSALEVRREEIQDQIDRWNREAGDADGKVRKLKESIKDIDKRVSEHEAKEAEQKIATARVEAAIDARDRVQRVKELFENHLRFELEKLVSGTFARISFTPYVPTITEKWTLGLLESSGGRPLPVAASQGESQVLSLAFISGIIELAKRKFGESGHLPGPMGAVYPMVMDSPFGSLDATHRSHVAEHLPDLADQVILLVTKTQWHGEVEQSLSGKVARSYVLTYCTPRDDAQTSDIVVDGRQFPLVKRSPNEYEYTTIQEVGRG